MPDVVRYWALTPSYILLALAALGGVLAVFTGAELQWWLLSLCPFLVLHVLALKRGWKLGWYLQLVWSLGVVSLGLLLMLGKFPGWGPLASMDGTFTPGKALHLIIQLVVLSSWFTLETQTWFGLKPAQDSLVNES